MTSAEKVIVELKKYANAKNIEGMARFGIGGQNVLGGPSIPVLRKMAKEVGKNHTLALGLWKSEIHEARLLASFVDNFSEVTSGQMEEWVRDFDSWDICDQVCSNLFDKTPYAWQKVFEWVEEEEEFVRRAGFVLMATLSVHDKDASDDNFTQFFPLIKKYSVDERNFVKKAVNWALRQIGKRNGNLNKLALVCAKDILEIDSKSARWIAKDAIRELENVDKLKYFKG